MNTTHPIDTRIADLVQRVRDLMWVSGYDPGVLEDLDLDGFLGWRESGITNQGEIDLHVRNLRYRDDEMSHRAADRLATLRGDLWQLREERDAPLRRLLAGVRGVSA